ncbi:hypothetical protein [Streptomyces tirandamycinicus]|uniref:Uncharacterized protein n=1 Tax=Streptomyces tirandamycinicus TaxID=2174846 RepID=A0A2S1T1T9_9ACTN|nr:hypothetical protein [Streptomyces tirandamycinicus]AWI32618.1 hypothetical protein DDW44_30320 [Streptomyces tirandamycinicus]
MSTAPEPTVTPSLAALSRAVDELCALPKEQMGASRKKHLRALEGAFQRAVNGFGLTPDAYDDLASLLAPDSVAEFLRLAARGLIRGDGKTEPESDAQIRARIRAMEIVAEHTRTPFMRPEMPPAPQPAPVVPPVTRALLLEHFKGQVERSISEPFRVRFLAMYGVVLDTAASSGTLAGQHVAHLARDLSTLRLQRPRGGRQTTEPPVEEWELSPATRDALAAYLPLRDQLTKPLEHPVKHLWVSLEHNNRRLPDGDVVQDPPGLPLRPRGVQRVFARAAQVLNEEMEKLLAERNAPQVGTAVPEWTPMPTRLEPLRRAVEDELRQREEEQGGVHQVIVLRGRTS